MRNFRMINQMRAAELIMRKEWKSHSKRNSRRRSRDRRCEILFYLMMRIGPTQSELSAKHLIPQIVPFGGIPNERSTD